MIKTDYHFFKPLRPLMISIKALLRTVFRRGLELAVIVLICIFMLDGIIYFSFRIPDSLPSALARLIHTVNISAARPQPAYDPADTDLSAVETVIIQYSETDAFENFEVFKNKLVTPIHHLVCRSGTAG